MSLHSGAQADFPAERLGGWGGGADFVLVPLLGSLLFDIIRHHPTICLTELSGSAARVETESLAGRL